MSDNACPGCPFRDGKCCECRPAAQVWSKSSQETRDAAIELERRWVEHGELWFTGNGGKPVRVDYDCEACGERVLDENYVACVRFSTHRDGYRMVRVCYACFTKEHGEGVVTTVWARVAQAKRAAAEFV